MYDIHLSRDISQVRPASNVLSFRTTGGMLYMGVRSTTLTGLLLCAAAGLASDAETHMQGSHAGATQLPVGHRAQVSRSHRSIGAIH